MKLGDVIQKERKLRGLSVEEVASRLGIPLEEYEQIEAGSSLAEGWGPKILANIAIKLHTPTSRLISKTGKASDAAQETGQCGKLIKMNRENRQISLEEFAGQIEVPVSELEQIERGESPMEKYGPLLLGFAEIIEQPIFNLFYPCGLPLDRLEDYP